MNRTWVTTVAIVVVLLTGLTGVVATPGARADGRPNDPIRVGPSADVHQLDRQGVRRYWTPERMRTALPLDLDGAGDQIAARATSADTANPAARARVAPGLRSVGKLFFSDSVNDYVCSAAAINSPERNLLVTAGHCVNTGGTPGGLLGLSGCEAGSYFRNFQFVPAYDNGAAPYGTWIGVSAIVPSEWIAGCDVFHRDQGIIAVAPQGGVNLVDAVGGNALAWNYPPRQDGVRVVGWPAESPYDGMTRQECNGSTTRAEEDQDAQMSCPLTGGASGGPWILRMASADTGFIFAVTSRRTTFGPGVLLAAPFDNSIEALMSAARVAVRPAARATTAPVAGRQAPRRGKLSLAAGTDVVGYGEQVLLSARARRVRKAVLQTREAQGTPWRAIAKVRFTGADWLPLAQTATPGLHHYRLVGKKKHGRKARSRTVTVNVLACPYPLDRSPSVVSATRCTSPVG